MTVLKFPKRKTLLELNQDELERATVEFSLANRAVMEARRKLRDISNALNELYRERASLLSKERK
jgi:flagellar biosynthesis chaperone FliJ